MLMFAVLLGVSILVIALAVAGIVTHRHRPINRRSTWKD